MTDYSKYSDDEINKALEKLEVSPAQWRGYNFIDDAKRCFEILIDEKLEFIPLGRGHEVRTMAENGSPIIAQNNDPYRAICECYLMLKEGN